MRELFDDQSIDAVLFATPDHWHALGTIWACQAGKDVYVEKPACHNLFEGRKMVEAARKYDRIVQHGTQARSNLVVQEGVRKLREGVIGEVYMARGICYKWRESVGRIQEEPVPPGVDYDLWVGPAPMKPFSRLRFHYNWHFLWDFGNGEIANQGVHQLDIARWGLGLDTLPSKIQSMGGLYVHTEDEQETPNTQVVSYQFEKKKLLLQFEVRPWITNREAGIGELLPSRGRRNIVGVIFYGSDGYMVLPAYNSYYTFLGENREPGPTRVDSGDPQNNLPHIANFFDAVRSRRPSDLFADIEEGRKSTAFALLANIAYRTGRTLSFDPEAENFGEDMEANSFLKRQGRPPFLLPTTV
jgi:predicted dehydrogenase